MMNGNQQVIAVHAPEQRQLHERSFAQVDAALQSIGLCFDRLGAIRFLSVVEHVQRVQAAFLHAPVPLLIAVIKLTEHDPQRIVVFGDGLHHLPQR
ncbi:hypothetical protein D3C72_1219200 [compost metagenome]